MTLLATIAMVCWVPAVLCLFMYLPPRRAVIVAFLGAWLFLPVVTFRLPMLPDYTKMSATCGGILLATAILDAGRLVRFRIRWFDLPLLVWCACPLMSSVANDLGFYDGITTVLRHIVVWWLPFFIGRVYFTDIESLRELAISIFIGGLCYVPFCLFEVRMSPMLHTMVYGYPQQSFFMAMRFGGWRPVAFMQTGLMVSAWMAAASLIGFWLWYTKSVRDFRGVPIVALLAILVFTTILCKSTGAIILLAVGMAALLATQWLRSAAPVLILLVAAVVFIGVRAFGLWDGSNAVEAARWAINDQRAQSLAHRFKNETVLAERALERPWFGWGGWGRARVLDEYGGDTAKTDGLWIIALGDTGFVGVISLFTALLLPPARLVLRLRESSWTRPDLAAPIALAMIVTLYVIDCLPNAMVNPIFMLCGGAIASMSLAQKQVVVPQVVSGMSRTLWPRVQ